MTSGLYAPKGDKPFGILAVERAGPGREARNDMDAGHRNKTSLNLKVLTVCPLLHDTA